MATKGRVLVVDDDTDFRESVALVLEQDGYMVVEAMGGHHALALLDRVSPDLVLVDVTMPSMSGLELVRELRRHAEARPFGIVAMSGAVQAESSPAEWFLAKPVSAELLLAIVGQFCGRATASTFWGARGQGPSPRLAPVRSRS